MALSNDEKAKMTAMLGYIAKLITNDKTISSDVEILKNSILNNDDMGLIEENLERKIYELKTQEEIDFIKEVVNLSSGFVNKRYLLESIDLFTATMSFAGDTLRDFIAKKLSQNTPSFGSDQKDQSYYGRLSMLAIMTRDVNLIQKAIEKINKA